MKVKFNRDQKMLYLILLPFIIWYAVFMFKPMYGMVIAFKDYSLFRGISGSEWVGLKNFKDFLTSPEFYVTLKNTLMLNVYSLLLEFPFAILLALMLNEVKNKYFKTIVQTASFIPYFIAIVVATGITVNILSPSTGVVNVFLEKLGFERVYFLAKPEFFRGIFTGLNMWKTAGFNAVIYLAALTAVDEQLYEAAKIDGANKFQQLRHITIPAIIPTIVVMLVLKVGSMLNVAFETVLLLYQPATYETADVISTYVYRTGMLMQDFGLATAVGLFNAVVGFILVYSANRWSKKVTQSSLW
ncbi:ABC transporter permease [Fusobacterium mortiferum]|jgi:putative aldouronate transport system permease protein|uniref:Sugar ABC transporter permease n=2 Tax=Fusobacterium mortiferum TaxID=850 RepID=A0A414PZG0_FUSMR|nr:ABC transporter permease subunit [Fusobacterium mortiferum]AVQ18401.1 sugar ABC transporter permease [Fusobacterium mortiferum ATCC 9817]EEO34637.1 ABC transporter, permease protein [Fusobacterium mortiferum ATCC 9817]MCF2626519.1 sugar ABC transporter permease [Fusobacterium mortiferum]MCF2699586.1 sugar ABC transporter permease [Fusobacterium mortiferum]MCI6381040.1 ABC transporter permease subunit [Fusobacterium mortiferum]